MFEKSQKVSCAGPRWTIVSMQIAQGVHGHFIKQSQKIACQWSGPPVWLCHWWNKKTDAYMSTMCFPPSLVPAFLRYIIYPSRLFFLYFPGYGREVEDQTFLVFILMYWAILLSQIIGKWLFAYICWPSMWEIKWMLDFS